MSEKDIDIEQEAEAVAESEMLSEAAEKETEETIVQMDEKQEEIDRLKNELDEEKNKHLRLLAEYDNYRKRTSKEKLEAYGDATIRTVSEFLSVIDNFERALGCECSDESFKNGMQMIFNQYNEILKKLNVIEIEANGVPFDPNFHNAVNQIEDENLGENTVASVFQKGYKLNDKVIRHAMVTVANP